MDPTSSRFALTESNPGINASEDKEAKKEKKEPHFSSTFGIIFSCLGCVVGTGNVWRFPRIAAQNSEGRGSLAFVLIWALFLFLWSSPMIMIEFALGRYCKCSPIQSFFKMTGKYTIWCGAWIAMVSFMISSYYSVILSWCLYFLYYVIVTPLPANEEVSLEVFNVFIMSYWPILPLFIGILLAGIFVTGGISWIEKVNNVLVPVLLLILLFTFIWSLTLPYADYGISFFFTPNWESLKNPRIWVDGACQNAFDTGAAMGLFIPYAAYMSRRNGIVRYATFIPMTNNFVSLICGVTIFTTVFSTLISTVPTLTENGILEIIKTSGPMSTGLTFIWIPVLFSKMSVMGKALAILFFLCLSCAGFSSLIAIMQLTQFTLMDIGLNRYAAGMLSALITFLMALPSALMINFLTNQDFVWGFALMLSGLMFQFLVVRYGVLKFRRVLINELSIGDWKLPLPWIAIITFIAPLEALGLLIWWAFTLISAYKNSNGEKWFEFGYETLMTTLVEWIGVAFIMIIINIILVRHPPQWMKKIVENYCEQEISFEESSTRPGGPETTPQMTYGTGIDNPTYAAPEEMTQF